MRRKLAILAISPALLVLGACDPESFGFSRFSSDFHYSYPLQNGGKLSIETFNGSVEVIGWDQEMVEIDGTKHAPTQREADELAIDVDHARFDAVEELAHLVAILGEDPSRQTILAVIRQLDSLIK